MTIFMLSLAGLPPLAGFFGKFYLFAAALRAGANHGLLWLVALALLGSFVSLYYYLAVLKAIFSEPALSEVERTAAPETGTLNLATGRARPTGGPESLRPINLDFLQRISLVLLAGAVLVLGLLPGGLVTLIAASLAPLQ
jgi:NADH:ubiquinone oxidoreductase subunit 2 (subunit N)